MDAIVNSVETNLNLSQSVVGTAILTAAGKEIEDELKKKATMLYAPRGSVYVTEGYRLKCKYVIHAISYGKEHSVQVSMFVHLSITQINSLQFVINSCNSKIFIIKSNDDIKYCQDVFGCFPVADIVKRRTAKFLKKFKEANDNNIVCRAQRIPMQLATNLGEKF